MLWILARVLSVCTSDKFLRLTLLPLASVVIYKLWRIERHLKEIRQLLAHNDDCDDIGAVCRTGRPKSPSCAHLSSNPQSTRCSTRCSNSSGSDSLTFYDVSAAAAAPGSAQLFEAVDAAAAHDPLAALQLLENSCSQFVNSCDYIWRHVQLLKMAAAGSSESGVDCQISQLSQAISVANSGVQRFPDSWQLHKWLALSAGARSQLVSFADTLADVKTFREHVAIALSQRPDDSLLHHALGRFYLEVALLPWWKRVAAARVLGALPPDCAGESLHHFRLADSVCGRVWPENRLFIARCLMQCGEVSRAREILIETRACVDHEPTGESVWHSISALLVQLDEQ